MNSNEDARKGGSRRVHYILVAYIGTYYVIPHYATVKLRNQVVARLCYTNSIQFYRRFAGKSRSLIKSRFIYFEATVTYIYTRARLVDRYSARLFLSQSEH